MDTEKPLKYIEDIEKFINHNLNLGYLEHDMTITELLQFTKNIKDSYIPMMKQINNTINL